MSNVMRQFELETKHGDHLVCWLEDDPRLRIGVGVTLSEDGGQRTWFVRWAGRGTEDKQSLHKPWRVGGLV